MFQNPEPLELNIIPSKGTAVSQGYVNDNSNVTSEKSSHTDQINELAEALSAFQGKVPIIPKNQEVKYKNVYFKYADLSDIIKTIQEPLALQKLSVLQATEYNQGVPYLVTMLIHSSGQWIKSRLQLNASVADMKAFGANLTYSRRYALSGILGLATDESDVDALPEIQEQHKGAPKKLMTGGQLAILEDLLSGNDELKKSVVAGYGVDFLSELNSDIFLTCKNGIVARLANGGANDES